MKNLIYQLISTILIFVLLTLPLDGLAMSQESLVARPSLPKTSEIIGITLYPQNPRLFDFIIDPGQSTDMANLDRDIKKMVDYFFASLTIPKNDLWVNLSPYEKNRIVPLGLGQTEMGRDLLAQDYQLKKITASLINPTTPTGKKFWKRIYQEAYKKFGTTTIPVNTFNKVWIIPDKAVVYENPQTSSAYVVASSLKVMLEEDYLSLHKHADVGVLSSGIPKSYAKAIDPRVRLTWGKKRGSPLFSSFGHPNINDLASQVIREIIIPELADKVNKDASFSPLRQVYHAMILAEWYKRRLQESFLAKSYVNQNKIRGIDLKDKNIDKKIYQNYLGAYRKGLYNMVKEDYDPVTQSIIPRKYFSGGIQLRALNGFDIKTTPAMLTAQEESELPSAKDLTVTVRADPAQSSEAQRLARIKQRLYPHGKPQAVALRMDHPPSENLLSLNAPFGHAVSFPNRITQDFYLSIPDGDKVAELFISKSPSLTTRLEEIYPVSSLTTEDLKSAPLPRAPKTSQLQGVGFSIRVNSQNPHQSFNLSALFGSGKSLRDFARVGPGDTTAREDVDAYVNGGKDIMVQNWQEIKNTPSEGVLLQAINQPGNTPHSRDEHTYVLRLLLPDGVNIFFGEDHRLTISSSHQEFLIKAELYSDHLPMHHLPLEELYSLDTLERWIQLQDDDQTWHPAGTPTAVYDDFKQNVILLRTQQINARPATTPDIETLKGVIQQQAHLLRLNDHQLTMALNPVRYFADIPFFKLDRFTRMLYTGQYLMSQDLPMLAGSPYYAMVFAPDHFIVQTEFMDLLRPEIVRSQFYALLKLEHDGQFPHELDTRHSSHNPDFQEARSRMLRADTEPLFLIYAQKILENEKLYGIDWNHPIRSGQTVGDIVTRISHYVLSNAHDLKNASDLEGLIIPKRPNDPRGSWRDGAPSTFYGKYIYSLQYLMIPGLEAIKEINTKKHMFTDPIDFSSLIKKWTQVLDQFIYTQDRQERIDALLNWYRWKIQRESNPRQGFDYVVALLEDAKRYYGLDYTFNSTSPQTLLASIKDFLERYMPHETLSGHAIARGLDGQLIKINDTDPFMFSLSTDKRLPMEEIKAGLKSEFLHVALGGTGTTSGELLTSLPMVLEKDRYVAKPVSVPANADIYEAHRINYHTVKWIAMEYKKLNGLIRQINLMLDGGNESSSDINHLIVAVLVRFDELSRLSNQETAETMESFAKTSDGTLRLDFRPFGTADALAQDDEEAHGIRSGAVQGFNLMVMAATINMERLLERLKTQEDSPLSPLDTTRDGLARNPAPMRQEVISWLEKKASPAKSNAAMIHDSNVGGIDLNSDLYDLQILKDRHVRFDTAKASTTPWIQIDGIIPRIVKEKFLAPSADKALLKHAVGINP